MKRFILSFSLVLLTAQFIFAQASLNCSGISLKVISVTENEIKVEVSRKAPDASGVMQTYPHLLHPTIHFSYTNGTCPNCETLPGENDVKIWTITNGTGPTSMTFSPTTGGNCSGEVLMLEEPAQNEMECGGIDLKIISSDNNEIKVQVDGTNYPHHLQSKFHFEFLNGQCIDCDPVSSKVGNVKIWTIKNQPGATSMKFTPYTGGTCKGKVFQLDNN